MPLPEYYSNPYTNPDLAQGYVGALGHAYTDSFEGYNSIGLLMQGLNDYNIKKSFASHKNKITKSKFDALGIRNHQWDENMTEGQAAALYTIQRNRDFNQRVLADSSEKITGLPSLGLMAASLTGTLSDPINMIPIVRESAAMRQVRALKGIQKAAPGMAQSTKSGQEAIAEYLKRHGIGPTASKEIRGRFDKYVENMAKKQTIMANIKDGIKLGAVGYAMSEPIVVAGRSYLDLPYTGEESFYSLVASVGFGGALHMANIYTPRLGNALTYGMLGSNVGGIIHMADFVTGVAQSASTAGGMFIGGPKRYRFGDSFTHQFFSHIDADGRSLDDVPVGEVNDIMKDWLKKHGGDFHTIHNVLKAIDTEYGIMDMNNDAAGMAEKRSFFMSFFTEGGSPDNIVFNFLKAAAEDFTILAPEERMLKMQAELERMAASPAEADLIKAKSFLDEKKIKMLTYALTDTISKQLKLTIDSGYSLDDFKSFYPAAYSYAVDLIARGDIGPDSKPLFGKESKLDADQQQAVHDIALSIISESVLSGRTQTEDGRYTKYNPFPPEYRVYTDTLGTYGPDGSPFLLNALGQPVLFRDGQIKNGVYNLGTDPTGQNWGANVVTKLPDNFFTFKLSPEAMRYFYSLGLDDAQITQLASDVFSGTFKQDKGITHNGPNIFHEKPYNISTILLADNFNLSNFARNSIGGQALKANRQGIPAGVDRVAATTGFRHIQLDNNGQFRNFPSHNIADLKAGKYEHIIERSGSLPGVDGRGLRAGDIIVLSNQKTEQVRNELGVLIDQTTSDHGVFKIEEVESLDSGIHIYDNFGRDVNVAHPNAPKSPYEQRDDFAYERKYDPKRAKDFYDGTDREAPDLIEKGIETGYVPKAIADYRIEGMPTLREMLDSGIHPDSNELKEHRMLVEAELLRITDAVNKELDQITAMEKSERLNRIDETNREIEQLEELNAAGKLKSVGRLNKLKKRKYVRKPTPDTIARRSELERLIRQQKRTRDKFAQYEAYVRHLFGMNTKDGKDPYWNSLKVPVRISATSKDAAAKIQAELAPLDRMANMKGQLDTLIDHLGDKKNKYSRSRYFEGVQSVIRQFLKEDINTPKQVASFLQNIADNINEHEVGQTMQLIEDLMDAVNLKPIIDSDKFLETVEHLNLEAAQSRLDSPEGGDKPQGFLYEQHDNGSISVRYQWNPKVVDSWAEKLGLTGEDLKKRFPYRARTRILKLSPVQDGKIKEGGAALTDHAKSGLAELNKERTSGQTAFWDRVGQHSLNMRQADSVIIFSKSDDKGLSFEGEAAKKAALAAGFKEHHNLFILSGDHVSGKGRLHDILSRNNVSKPYMAGDSSLLKSPEVGKEANINVAAKYMQELMNWAKQGQEIKPEMTMAMNFGTGGKNIKRPDFKGETTMDWILSGQRSATTRRSNQVRNIKKGQIIKFTGQGKEVLVRVTSDPYETSGMSADQWSRLEGWDVSMFDTYGKEGYSQFTYELIPDKKVPDAIGIQAGSSKAIFGKGIEYENLKDRTPQQSFDDVHRHIANTLESEFDSMKPEAEEQILTNTENQLTGNHKDISHIEEENAMFNNGDKINTPFMEAYDNSVDPLLTRPNVQSDNRLGYVNLDTHLDQLHNDVAVLRGELEDELGIKWLRTPIFTFDDGGPIDAILAKVNEEVGGKGDEPKPDPATKNKFNDVMQGLMTLVKSMGVKLVFDDNIKAALYSPSDNSIKISRSFIDSQSSNTVALAIREEVTHAMVEYRIRDSIGELTAEKRKHAFEALLDDLKRLDPESYKQLFDYYDWSNFQNVNDDFRSHMSSMDSLKGHVPTANIAQEFVAMIFAKGLGRKFTENQIMSWIHNKLQGMNEKEVEIGRTINAHYDDVLIPQAFRGKIKEIIKQIEALNYWRNNKGAEGPTQKRYIDVLTPAQHKKLETPSGYFTELRSLLHRIKKYNDFDKLIRDNDGNHEVAFHKTLESIENTRDTYIHKFLGDFYGELDKAGLTELYMKADKEFQSKYTMAKMLLEQGETLGADHTFKWRDQDVYLDRNAVAIGKILYNADLKKINEYNSILGEIKFNTMRGVPMLWNAIFMQNGGKSKNAELISDHSIGDSIKSDLGNIKDIFFRRKESELLNRLNNKMQTVDDGRKDFIDYMLNEVDINHAKTFEFDEYYSQNGSWVYNAKDAGNNSSIYEIKWLGLQLYLDQNKIYGDARTRFIQDYRDGAVSITIDPETPVPLKKLKSNFDNDVNLKAYYRHGMTFREIAEYVFFANHYDKVHDMTVDEWGMLKPNKEDGDVGSGDFYRSKRSELQTTIFYNTPMDRMKVMEEFGSYDPNLGFIEDRRTLANDLAIEIHTGKSSEFNSPMEQAMDFFSDIFPKVKEDFGKHKDWLYPYHWFFYNIAKRGPEDFAREALGLNDLSANNTITAIDDFMKFGVFIPPTIGMAAVTSLSDFGTIRKTLDDSIGDLIHKPVWSTIIDSIQKHPERKHEIKRIGVTAALTLTNMLRATGSSGSNMNKMRTWNKFVFDVSGMNYIMDLGRTVFTSIFMTGIGSAKDMDFDSLPENTRNTFAEYGINQYEWDVIRSNSKKIKWGEEGFSEDFDIISRIEDVNPEALKVLAISKGYTEVTDSLYKRLADEVDTKYQKMLNTEMNKGVLMPGYLERTLVTLGFQSGTWQRAILGNMALYHQYPMAFIKKHFGKNMADLISGNPQSQLRTAYFMGYMVMLAYLLNLIKDMLSNREPRLWGKSAAWGAIAGSGFGGVYTSMLSGEWDSDEPFFNRIANYHLGVPKAKLDKVFNILDAESPGTLGSKTIQAGRAFIPGENHFMTRAALDRFVFQPSISLFDDGEWIEGRDNALEKLGSGVLWQQGEGINLFD